MKDERRALLVVSVSVPRHQAGQTCRLSSTILDARTPTVPTASASPLLCARIAWLT